MQYHYHSHAHGSHIQAEGEHLILQTGCPPCLIEALQADGGLVTFARRPEREHARLLEIACHPEASLSLAYTQEGLIVGQLTLAPVYDWWLHMEDVYEIAIEVSPPWRRKGIAHHLMNLTLEGEGIEDLIILAPAFTWHWDTKGTGLTYAAYRDAIARFLARYSFMEYLTTEPNISADPYNILLARIGMQVPLEKTLHFYQALIR